MSRFSRLTRLFCAALLLLVWGRGGRPARAMNIFDPLPPMKWREMLRECPVAVVAVCTDFHGTPGDPEATDQTITLQIQRVLWNYGGGEVSPGSVLPVALHHWYSVMTRTPPQSIQFPAKPEEKDDGVPRLCYRRQFSNPGPLEPYVLQPDIRKTTLYFLTSTETLTGKGVRASPVYSLERRGQVQPTEDADAWATLKQGRTDRTLIFRLTQDIDAEVRRDALEELARIRDPANIEALFRNIEVPNGRYSRASLNALMQIGDRNGDVYNVAAARFQKGFVFPDDSQPHSAPFPIFATMVMASVDPARALKDFEPYLSRVSVPQASVAVYALSFAPTEASVDRLIRLKDDPQLGKEALQSLARLLQNESTYPFFSFRSNETHARLLAYARPQFPAILQSASLASLANLSGSETFLRDWLTDQIVQNAGPRIDEQKAEALLRNPNPDKGDFDTWGKAPGSILLKRITESGDPRYLPLLVTAIRNNAPSLNETYVYQEALRRYALICPNAFRRELKAQGVDAEFAKRTRLVDNTLYQQLMVQLGEIGTREELHLLPMTPSASASYYGFDGSFLPVSEIARRYEVSPGLLGLIKPHSEEAVRNQKTYGRYDTYNFGYAEMAFLLAFSPGEGRNCFHRVFALRDQIDPANRVMLYGMAVQQGERQYIPALIDTVRQVDTNYKRNRNAEWDGTSAPETAWLLVSRDEEALRAYLALTDGERHQIERTVFLGEPLNQRLLNPTYVQMIGYLLPEHPKEFFARALFLLESPDMVDRSGVAYLLNDTLHTTFGFDVGDVEANRRANLPALRATFQRLAGAHDETGLRRLLLEGEGIQLKGRAGPGWLPTLVEAIHQNPGKESVIANALLLIEQITTGQPTLSLNNDKGILSLLPLSPGERERAVATLLADYSAAQTK